MNSSHKNHSESTVCEKIFSPQEVLGDHCSSIQIDSFEEQKQKDIKRNYEIEQLIRECRKDFIIDDGEEYEVYSDSNGKEGVDMEIMHQNESSEQLCQFNN